MSSKHCVVVDLVSLQSYQDMGYSVSEESVESHLGAEAWAALGAKDKKRLLVVEIDAAKKEALDAARTPVRYHTDLISHTFTCSARVVRCDVKETEQYRSIVAPHEGGGPYYITNKELFESPRQAVDLVRTELLEQIRELRTAADDLEEFLRRHEAL